MSKIEVVLAVEKQCNSCVKFGTDPKKINPGKVPITNVYVSRALDGISNAAAVRITIEPLGLADAQHAEVQPSATK